MVAALALAGGCGGQDADPDTQYRPGPDTAPTSSGPARATPSAPAGPPTQAAFDAKLASLAEVIDAQQPDVLALQELTEVSGEARYRDAALGGVDAIEAFGKAAIIGSAGEIEHGGALIHMPYFGNLMREFLNGESIICFAHDWGGDPTSKTHIMRILSDKNRILWVNSIGMRRPAASGRDVEAAP